jgi:hypothetical protein
VPDGFARTADGTLHLVYETSTSWGNAANGVGAVTISPSGSVGAPVQALSWNGPTSGAPNGIPGLAILSGGTLEATFGGSPTGDDGPWGISSTSGGSTWTAPADIGSGSMEFGDSHVNVVNSNGTPVLSAGCCGGIVIQQGFGPGAPTSQITNSTDGAAGNVDSVVDAATGAVVDSWDSADSVSPWFQQVAPSLGAAAKPPIPSQYGSGLPLIIAGRDTGPGVFAAYAADYTNTTHIRLLRYGGGSVAVGNVKGLHAKVIGDATGLDGRIWVMWYGNVGLKGIIAVTRSNKAVTRFEPIQQFRFADWPFLFALQGDGRLGPLDMLINGTAPPQPLTAGIYYSRMLPELSASVSVHKTKSGKFKLEIKVTDAGDAVSGAKASAAGQSQTTNANGKATLTVSGKAGDHVGLKVSSPGYLTLRKKVKL